MEDLTEKERKCIRYLTKEMQQEDRSVFEIEINIDYELRMLYENYRSIWKAYPIEQEFLHSELSKQKILGKVRRSKSYRKLYSLAAVIFIAIIGGLTFLIHSANFNYTNLKIAEEGERLKFFLPDSSKVVLNSGSTLKYMETLSNPREVWLEGEAFFDVRKDTENPFIVHTEDIQINVKGTSFGVNTLSENQTISLETGKVKVLLKNTNDEVYLLPNEQLIWNKTANKVIKKNFDPEKILAWKENILFLDNIPFSKAISKINTFYGVVFSIDEESLRNQRITGAFKDQNLEEFISALEFITNIKVIKESSTQFTIQASDEHEN
ncbi:FecR family protein [Salegentibacter agarivorans]|jgi:ferric-dicitrate binding protein FerR (iron transport regulator)